MKYEILDLQRIGKISKSENKKENIGKKRR